MTRNPRRPYYKELFLNSSSEVFKQLLGLRLYGTPFICSRLVCNQACFLREKRKSEETEKKDRFLPICGKKRSKNTRKGCFLRV